jgi:hypothetical protein
LDETNSDSLDESIDFTAFLENNGGDKNDIPY